MKKANSYQFDDPISSLDQDYEESVVQRLCSLATDRQVIVFTHRLSLLGLVQDYAKKTDIGSEVICIREESWGTGEPGDTPLFAGSGYAGMSETAMYFVGGVLKHSRSLAGFTNPTTNSYRRLVPGFEAPVNLAYSQRNRSAAIRFPMYSISPKAKRIEIRYPDPSCNPYLAFSALLMAGLDGIQNKIDPGDPLDKDIYDLPPEELADVPVMPGSLDEALSELENDYEFLLKGDVFTEDVVKTWIDYKMENEVKELRMRPHPWEFAMYYDL